MQRVARAIIAAFICAACAIPSLIWSQDFDVAARATGLAIFAVATAMIVMTRWFTEWWRDDNLRIAIRIGYGLRLAVSLAFPVGMAIDLFPGLLSMSIVGIDAIRTNPSAAPASGTSYLLVLHTTIVQGVLLHVMLWLFIGAVWPIVMAARRRRHREIPAFPVIMPTSQPQAR